MLGFVLRREINKLSPYIDKTVDLSLASIEYLDYLLDAIPVYSEGKWYRYGAWGCRMHMHKLWWKEERENGRS